MMADSGSFLHDQFQCSICLELFTFPVTLPCGHNFCRRCITQAWDVSSRNQCPLCKEDFGIRPELRVNTTLSETSATLRQTEPRRSRRTKWDVADTEAEDVRCDACLEDKQKAVKSCLVCVASYCQVHLEPHTRILGLKRHQLIEPVRHLEDRVCKKHERLLELFCRSDQSFLCQQCVPTDHRRHILVPLKKEFEQKRAALDQNMDDLNQRIQDRQKKIEELELNLNLIRDESRRETATSVRVFTSFIQTAQKFLSRLLENIETRQRTAEEHVQVLMAAVREEISELEKTKEELEKLLQTDDQLQFLQNFKSLELEESKDWGSEVKVQASYEGVVRSAVTSLQEEISSELKKLTDAELRSIQRFAVDISLDRETAHSALILSDDDKHVHCGDAKQSVPHSASRFSDSPCVLGKQRFGSGKFYYEVEVKNKTKWYLGVAKESINRKGQVAASPAMGLWVIWLKSGKDYRALDEPAVPLMLERRPERVGVFVDYDEGLVAFYDPDTAARMYLFTGCKFTEKLRPFFGPCSSEGGMNKAPLVITQVRRKMSAS